MMAMKWYVVVCVLVVLGNISESGSATAESPPPMADCGSLVLEMADCLSFVSSGSSDKKPQGSCCSGIKTVLKTNAQCLCFAFRNSAQFGVTLNLTKAMTLPDVCRLSHPPLTNCDLNMGARAPAMAPDSSPGPTTSDGGAEAPTPISGANEVNPTQLPLGGPPSASGSSGSSSSFLLLILLVWCLPFNNNL